MLESTQGVFEQVARVATAVAGKSGVKHRYLIDLFNYAAP
jgi:hypothetical protein